MASNRVFSNIQFLTMEENSFAVVNAKKKKEKKENNFISENVLCYTQKFEHPTPKISACLVGHFIVTYDPTPHDTHTHTL